MEADVIVCEDTRITGKLFKMIKTKNLDQDINTFQENEKEEENDEKVFDYLSQIQKVDHLNLLGIKRNKKKLRDIMQKNDVEETRQISENKLMEMDTLGFLQKYNQEQYENEENVIQKTLFNNKDKKKQQSYIGIDSEYIKYIKSKIEESKLINKRGLLISANKFTELDKVGDIINILKAGIKVCLVSDSGTPCISDPGFVIINQAIENNIMVQSIPGPNAINLCLTSSGFPADQYYFGGYLSKNYKEKTEIIKKMIDIGITGVIFENKNRLIKTLQILEKLYGKQQEIFIGVELTKLHERQLRGTIEQVYDLLNKNPDYTIPSLRGEITIVIAPYNELFNQQLESKSYAEEIVKKSEKDVQINIEKIIADINEFMDIDRKNLIQLVMKITGNSKNTVYGHVLRYERKNKQLILINNAKKIVLQINQIIRILKRQYAWIFIKLVRILLLK